jgi:hypothetical protein
MKLRLTLLAFGVALFGVSFVCLSTRAHVLTAAEAQAVIGSEADKECITPTTCVVWNNQFQTKTIDCPNDANLCFWCSLGSSPWETCVVSAGHTCTVMGTNDCGNYEQGSCNGSVCTFLQHIGSCSDAPHCTGT